MARLPSEADLGGLPSLDSGRPVASADMSAIAQGGEALGRGLATLGAGIEQGGDARDRFELARARADFLTAKIGLDEQYKEDQNWQDLPARYGKDLSAARDAAMGSITNARAREQFRFSVNPTFMTGLKGAEGVAKTRAGQVFKADTVGRLDNLRRNALRSTDETERAAAIKNGSDMIDALAEAGHLDPLTAAAQKRAWVKDYAVAAAEVLPVEERVNLLRRTPTGRDDTLTRIAQVESGGDPNAKAATSSALGPFQFTRTTWLDTIRRHRPDLKEGRSDAELLELRRDPTLSRELAGHLLDDNSRALSAAGVEVNPGSQYLAHFLGAGDAAKVLRADPGTPVADLIDREKIAANRSILQGKTAGSVAQWAQGKMGGGGAIYDFIPEDDRIKLLRSAETELRTLNTQRETAETKALKDLGDDFLREAYTRADSGDLTNDYVNAIVPFVSPAEGKALREMLKGKDNVDDPEAVIALEGVVHSEDPEEFQKIATGYLRTKKIKTSTFSTLIGKNRTAFRDDQPASPYKAGREIVKMTLDPGQLLSGPAAAIGRNAMGQALIEFDNWAQAKPSATREESIAEAQNIVKRYQVVPFEQMKLAVGSSRYFGTKTREQVTAQDIEAAEQKLFADIEAGLLTKAQQEFEIRLLENWREILAREERTRQEAPGAGRKR